MINPNIAEPNLRSVLEQIKREVMTGLNCHMLGTIVSFDGDKQAARVRLNFQTVVYNQPPGSSQTIQPLPTIYAYPVLIDCPVMVLTGGTGVLTMPVAAGDTCLVLFHDRDIDLWYTTGGVVPPNTPRVHDMSDGLVIVGFRSNANPVSDYSTTDIELRNLGGKIGVAQKIAFENAATSLLLTLTAAMDTLTLAVTAMTALNLKTGPDASVPIAAVAAEIIVVRAQIDSLLK